MIAFLKIVEENVNLHQPKASREQYIQSPLFQYSWTCGGKILFVWHGMCFCTKAILAWCFEKLSQAHHCLILGNWARLNFLRSHARLTLVTPSPYHTADNSAVTSSIIRAPGVTEKTTATSKFYSYPFPSLTLVFLLPCVFPHHRSPLEKEMAKRPRLPPFFSSVSSHLPCLIFQPLTNSGRFSQVARLVSSVRQLSSNRKLRGY